MNHLKLKNVIFCEIIRPELGGKYTLLGASAPELQIPMSAVPATISGSIFVTGFPQKVGPFSVEIRITNPDKQKIIGGKLEGDFTSTAITSLAIGPLPVVITKAGYYNFEWNFDGKKWATIERLNIIIVSDPVASNLPPNA